jgi:hypothetical protein
MPLSHEGGIMSVSLVLTIIGILVSVLFGIWGVFLVIRKRYPGELTLITNDCIPLFDAIVKNLPELTVLYGGEPVSQGLVLFKGTLLNSGNKDISPDMVEGKVALGLPEDFKWLSAKVVAASPNANVKVETEADALRFSTGLFRCSEYFRFEALAEVPIDDGGDGTHESAKSKLIDGIEATHRIADTRKVQRALLDEEVFSKRRLRRRMVMASAMVIVGIIGMLITLIKVPGTLHFEIPDGKGGTVEIEPKFLSDGNIRIRAKDHGIDECFNGTEFFSRRDVRPKVVAKVDKFMVAVFFIFYILVPMGLICLGFWKYRKWTRLRKQIGLN